MQHTLYQILLIAIFNTDTYRIQLLLNCTLAHILRNSRHISYFGIEVNQISTTFRLIRHGVVFQPVIDISHNRDGETPDVLTKDDLRRAWQLPQDVISAGVPGNPRK